MKYFLMRTATVGHYLKPGSSANIMYVQQPGVLVNKSFIFVPSAVTVDSDLQVGLGIRSSLPSPPSRLLHMHQAVVGYAAGQIPLAIKMRQLTIFILMFLVTLSVHGQKTIKGDIEYSMATYSDELFVDKKYGAFLDSLLKKPVFEYFRDTDIKNLPIRDKDKPKGLTPSESHIIEPLFINMTTFNGVYAKRIWSLNPKARTAVRFRCGFYHRIFIISDDKYTELSKDTLKNEKLIRNLLTADFSDKEILRMTEYFKYETICEQYTFLPSFYIKRDDKILFDAEKIKND